MDLEEWDLLADDGFFDQNKDDIGDNFCSKSIQNTTTMIDMNYFQKFDEPQEKNEEIPEEVIKFPIETVKIDYRETVSQNFFKNLKGNEFADMKLDSPKSLNMGNFPQIDLGTYQFEELEKKSVDSEENDSQLEELSNINKEEKIIITSGDEVSGDCDDDKVEGLNIWKWAMTGIGALFSFGFAAATVSFIVLGNHHKGSSCNTNKQEIHFQIFSHDKMISKSNDTSFHVSLENEANGASCHKSKRSHHRNKRRTWNKGSHNHWWVLRRSLKDLFALY